MVIIWEENWGNGQISTALKPPARKLSREVTNYFSKLNVVEIKMETGNLSVGDNVLYIGSTTGVIEDIIREIRVDLKPLKKQKKGNCVPPC